MTDSSIKNPNYKERPELNYTHGRQYETNLRVWRKTGHPLYPPTKLIYEYIRNSCIDIVKNHPQYPKFNWKPKICDVGCGSGCGTYLLSQEADFAWGIDMDEESIRFAKGFYERHKNNIYYSPQLTFEVIDIRKEPREIMAFDIVACIEVIEHIADYEKTLTFLKRLCKKDKKGNYLEPPNATFVYISSPNRNFPRIGDDITKNRKHVREWTPSELYDVLTKHFKYVTLLNPKGEQVDLDMKDQAMLLKCETPL